jgi:hypothetical protein
VKGLRGWAVAKPPRLFAIGITAAVTALVVLHASHYLPFFTDDAFISLRYARRLLDGHGLTWTDGERVEGYSNLLWVLACAALGRFGLDLIVAARVLGLAAVAATIAAVVRAAAPSSLAASLPAVAGGLTLALSAPVVVYSIAGLEQPLVAALLSWAVVAALPLIEDRKLRPWDSLVPGIPLALLCLSRPDGGLFAAALAAGVVLARGFARGAFRAALWLCAPPALATLGQLAFRVSYYGDWLPNTARVKLVFSTRRLVDGGDYLLMGALAMLPVLVLAVVGVVRAQGSVLGRRSTILIAVPLLAWGGYVVTIGGDIFPARRHMVPIVVLVALLIALCGRAAGRSRRTRTLAITTLILLAVFGVIQLRESESLRAKGEMFEWEGAVIGRMLARSFGDRRPLLAVDLAGSLPYFSNLPSIDMLGLNDRTIARHPPHDFGQGWIGHELGYGKYVLDRKPDLVIFCGPRGSVKPCFLSDASLVADARFSAEYRPVQFEGLEPFPVTSVVWVRWRDGPLGAAWENGRLVIPGWLLSSNLATRVRLDGEGRMGAVAEPHRPAVVFGIPIPKGRFLLRADTSDEQVRISVYRSESRERLATGTGSVGIALEKDESLDIEVAVISGGNAHVRGIVLEPTSVGR